MGMFRKGLYFSPDDDGAGGEQEQGEQQDQENEALGWDTFHASLTEEAQALIEAHESGLKTALKSEREARGELESKLKELASKMEEGSEARKEADKLANEVALGNQKADFYEEAHEEGVSNLKLAYVVAVQDGLISSRGKIDFKTMKEEYPELFGRKIVPPGAAGEGTGGRLPGEKVDMNALIRKKAGR